MKLTLPLATFPSDTIIRKLCGARNIRVFHHIRAFAAESKWTQAKTYPYKRTYKSYPKFENTAYIQSWAEISENKQEISGVVINRSFKLKACKGYCFDTDNNGIKLVSQSNPKDDLHLNSELVFRKTTELRRILLSNRARRIQIKMDARMNKRREEIFQKNINSTVVTVEDARRAGNCAEGIRAFIQRNKLNINFGVPATFLKRLISKELSVKERIENSIRKAFDRETLVCI